MPPHVLVTPTLRSRAGWGWRRRSVAHPTRRGALRRARRRVVAGTLMRAIERRSTGAGVGLVERAWEPKPVWRGWVWGFEHAMRASEPKPGVGGRVWAFEHAAHPVDRRSNRAHQRFTHRQRRAKPPLRDTSIRAQTHSGLCQADSTAQTAPRATRFVPQSPYAGFSAHTPSRVLTFVPQCPLSARGVGDFPRQAGVIAHARDPGASDRRGRRFVRYPEGVR